MKIDTYISPFMDPPFMPGIKIISTIHDITFLKVNKANTFILQVKRSLLLYFKALWVFSDLEKK